MSRQFFLDLAGSGLRMPIGAHLVLHGRGDPGAALLDGERLGRVVEETARRFRTPLAFPLMDLKLEKEALLRGLGVTASDIDTYHFAELPDPETGFRISKQMLAACGAIRHIATRTDLFPVGMVIGPFSLMTKLVSDPIAPVYLAGAGATAADEHEVALVERVLEVSLRTIRDYAAAQIDSGARAVIVCEPAANTAFFSPKQLADSYDVFEKYVMTPNRVLRDQFAARGVELIFHDCGELLEGMIRRLAQLDPVMMSLGSSRKLWEDAAWVPKTTVLYGNLPTKQFYSDELITVARARELSAELAGRMKASGHPFILGSECDVLSVPGREEAINAKVEAVFIWPDGSNCI